MNVRGPSHSVGIQAKIDGVWTNIGCGFRVSYGIVSAWHVLMNTSVVRLVTPDGSTFEIQTSSFEVLENVGDIAILRVLDPALQGKVTCGKLTKANQGKCMVMCTAQGRTSIGQLSLMGDVFGQVEYTGSTTKGFSGSPYYLNNVIHGMHLGSTNMNVGYDAAYLNVVLAPRGEASEDYYLSKLSKGQQHQLQINPSDPDEVIVQMGGRYIKMDRVDYEAAMERYDQAADERAFGDAHRASAYDKAAISAMRKAEHKSYGKQAGGRLVRREGGIDAAPRIDFDDSENYERPSAAACSSTGGQLPTQIDVVKRPDPHISPETAFPSLNAGSLQDTARQELPPVTRNVHLPITSAFTQDSMPNDLITGKPGSGKLKMRQKLVQRVLDHVNTTLHLQRH